MGQKKNSTKINPNEIKARDPLMVALICGTTKAGVYKDLKKDSNKYRARGKYRGED